MEAMGSWMGVLMLGYKTKVGKDLVHDKVKIISPTITPTSKPKDTDLGKLNTTEQLDG
jgi:hypothetical protein